VKGFVRRHRIASTMLSAFAASVAGLWIYACAAPFDSPESKLSVPGTVVLDANGVVLQRDGAEGFRIPVALGDVSPVMRDATIAAEDQRFETHPGVDPIAMARAVIWSRSEHSGASTITQQLARRLYLDGGGGPLPLRKARESLIALQLEAHRSKDEILELYLNEVYYGRGAYGIEAAARVYFGVSAANLDLARAAFLAGLPQLPSAYQDADSPAAASRRDYVLERLADDGKITREAAEAAASEPLAVLPALEPAIGAQFVAYARQELASLRPDLADVRGLVIETTLDAGLQVEAERLARQQLEKLRDRNVTNAAVVVVDPATGAILAMVGSTSGDINLAVTPRQPGSALKPFLYGAAFELGFTPATPLLDVPTTFIDGEERYEPQDFDRRYRGVVSLRTALGSSLNIPAVATLEQVGLDGFLRTANAFGLGLTDAERYGLSLTLGGGEVRLLDLTGAYAALASGGELTHLFAVTRVRDSAGRVLYERPPAVPARVLRADYTYLLSDILSDRDARVPGFGQVTPFDLPFTSAVKTGTTTGFRDNWTLGYTANFAVGVWVGNADGSAMRDVSGVDGAGPIWRDVMLATASTRTPSWPQRPAGIVEATVCSPVGLLPGPDCPYPVRELFVAGTVPRQVESYYVRRPDGELAIVPPPAARAWALDAGLPLAGEQRAAAENSVRIVSPASGSTLYLAPELTSQEVMLRATAGPGAQEITFRVNGVVAGTAPGADARLVYPLRPGHYEVEATALYAQGVQTTTSSTFEVKPR